MYSQFTDYHKIYQQSHWGKMKDSKPSEIIIKNRNKFANDCDIKKYCNIKPKYIIDETKGTHFDHNEYYTDKNGEFVIVSNPYDEHDDFFFEKGWRKYEPMYHEDCMTYIKKVGKGKKGK